MIKALSILGTRPEAIKMAPVVKELEGYPDQIISRVCVTVQHCAAGDQGISSRQGHLSGEANGLEPVGSG